MLASTMKEGSVADKAIGLLEIHGRLSSLELARMLGLESRVIATRLETARRVGLVKRRMRNKNVAIWSVR